MNKYHILITVLALQTTACKPQTKNNTMETKATVWTTIHRNMVDENGEHSEVDITFFDNPDFIKESGIAVKAVTAYFSACISMDTANELKLAQALGDFSTLQQARDSLLQNKEHIFENIEIKRAYYANLEIEIDENIVDFEFSNQWGNRIETYRFKIDDNGNIEYMD